MTEWAWLINKINKEGICDFLKKNSYKLDKRTFNWWRIYCGFEDTFFNDAEQEELPEGIRYQFSWDEIKRDLIALSYGYFNQQIKKHKF